MGQLGDSRVQSWLHSIARTNTSVNNQQCRTNSCPDGDTILLAIPARRMRLKKKHHMSPLFALSKDSTQDCTTASSRPSDRHTPPIDLPSTSASTVAMIWPSQFWKDYWKTSPKQMRISSSKRPIQRSRRTTAQHLVQIPKSGA